MRSAQFTFVIGKEKTPILIHQAVLEKISAPLHALVSNGTMKESRARFATLEDVDVETFVAFVEFAYKDDYETPGEEKHVPEPPQKKKAKAKPNRITKRLRAYNRDLIKMKESYNKKNLIKTKKNLDFDDFLFENIWDSFQLRVCGSLSSEKFNVTALLFHAKLYVFSTKYLVETLQQRCLKKLSISLYKYAISSEKVDCILELLDYVYSHTGRTEPLGPSPLRDLVIHYVASKMPILSKHEEFFALLDSHAEMGSDLAKEMLR